MRVSLIIASGKKASLSVKIKPGVSLIGRAKSCQVRPKTSTVCERHCAIICTEDDVWIEDLGSKEGTLLNRKRVTERTRLRTGDRLRTGKVKFTFVVKGHELPWGSGENELAAVAAAPPQAEYERADGQESGAFDEPEHSISPEPFDEMDLCKLLLELDETDRLERVEQVHRRSREIAAAAELESETWFEQDDAPHEDSNSDTKVAVKTSGEMFQTQRHTRLAAAKGLKQIVTGKIDVEKQFPLPSRLAHGEADGSHASSEAGSESAKTRKKARKKAKQRPRKVRQGPSPVVVYFQNLAGDNPLERLMLLGIVCGLGTASFLVFRAFTYNPALKHAMFVE